MCHAFVLCVTSLTFQQTYQFWFLQKFDKIKIMEKTNSPFVSAYLRFLQLAKVIQALPDGMEMDANEKALLQAVVLRWYENQPMTVREAIALADLGSPATLHKRITRLREKDMLSTLNLEGDRRAKFLIPTQRTLDYFSHLGQSMQVAHQELPA
jgi:DNA-binding MarR family transcriptional regulator